MELDRQIATLIDRGYPAAAGLSDQAFADLCEPLRPAATHAQASRDDRFPFVLVVRPPLVSTHSMVERIEVAGRQGFTEESPQDHAGFVPIDGVDVPDSPVYLITDVDTGVDSLDMRPDEALPIVVAQGRTPLTMDEGLALITQFPDVLTTHNAYQLMGSRCGDRRVTAVWMSKRRPRLGWCWAGNHHTWLGMASAGARLGVDA